MAPQPARPGRTAPPVCPDRPRSLCAGRIAGRRKCSSRLRGGDLASFRAHLRGGSSGGNEVFRAAPHDRRRRARRVRRQSGRRGQRLRPVRPRQRVQRAHDARLRQDRRDRRCLRRPERGQRSQHLSQQLRAAGVHDRQRLLQESQPERRDQSAPRGEQRLGVGDHARPRDGLGDLSELSHPARRGKQPHHREPRYRRQHGRRAGRGRGLEQLRRLRSLERDEQRHLVLQAPGRGDRRLVR